MKHQEAMSQLKSMGTAQNCKIYKRHGAGDNLYGVSFANLKLLKKKIKQDHELAVKLWATNNSDAMTLATMIIDMDQVTEDLIDSWLASTEFYMLVDFLAEITAKQKFAKKSMATWMKSDDPFEQRAGWTLLGYLASQPDTLTEKQLQTHIKKIEKNIHGSKDKTKEAMNRTLICIGGYNDAMRIDATAAAKRIGKVEVDHGDTSCKTPDAASYIDKMWARKSK